MSLHKVFISYHHGNDQAYKKALVEANEEFPMFIDMSVDTGDIDDSLPDEAIRQKIRDEYLRDSTVTIVLVGKQTRRRKHVDWEIYSSMFDRTVNKKSGIVVIILPEVDRKAYYVAHDGEKESLFPAERNWIDSPNEEWFDRHFPYMPDRIVDNLVNENAWISVVPWSKLQENVWNLKTLIDGAFRDRTLCQYDLSRRMRRANS